MSLHAAYGTGPPPPPGGAGGPPASRGPRGPRIDLAGAPGGWGDLVAPSHAVAVSAAEKSGI
ncbi:hypothetical protein ACWDPI_35530, partial [Streptomyces zhihengii]